MSGQPNAGEPLSVIDGTYSSCGDTTCSRPVGVGWYQEFGHGTALIPSCVLHWPTQLDRSEYSRGISWAVVRGRDGWLLDEWVARVMTRGGKISLPELANVRLVQPQVLPFAAWQAFLGALPGSGWLQVDERRREEIERTARSSAFSMDYLWAAVAISSPHLSDAEVTLRIALATGWREQRELLPS